MSENLNIPCKRFIIDIIDVKKFNSGVEIMRWIESNHLTFLTTSFNTETFEINCATENEANSILRLLQSDKKKLSENGCRINSNAIVDEVISFTKEEAMRMLFSIFHQPENTGVKSVFVPK